MFRDRRNRLPRVRTISRYDVVLGIIPIVFMVSLLMASIGSLTVEEAIAGSSIIAVLALIDALFLNPPGVSTTPPENE